MTNITVRVDPTDRNINIQCHAVNQEVADTRVESHTISVLCKYISFFELKFMAVTAEAE